MTIPRRHRVGDLMQNRLAHLLACVQRGQLPGERDLPASPVARSESPARPIEIELPVRQSVLVHESSRECLCLVEIHRSSIVQMIDQNSNRISLPMNLLLHRHSTLVR